jgi:hypothetical protein
LLFKTLGSSVYGIDVHLVEVEVVPWGIPDFNVVGLPDNAGEAESRTKSSRRFDDPASMI